MQRNMKDHYRVQRRPPTLPIMKQTNPIHTTGFMWVTLKFSNSATYFTKSTELVYCLMLCLRISALTKPPTDQL